MLGVRGLRVSKLLVFWWFRGLRVLGVLVSWASGVCYFFWEWGGGVSGLGLGTLGL